MKLILALILLISIVVIVSGCKFYLKEFDSHIGEIQAITEGFDK